MLSFWFWHAWVLHGQHTIQCTTTRSSELLATAKELSSVPTTEVSERLLSLRLQSSPLLGLSKRRCSPLQADAAPVALYAYHHHHRWPAIVFCLFSHFPSHFFFLFFYLAPPAFLVLLHFRSLFSTFFIRVGGLLFALLRLAAFAICVRFDWCTFRQRGWCVNWGSYSCFLIIIFNLIIFNKFYYTPDSSYFVWKSIINLRLFISITHYNPIVLVSSYLSGLSSPLPLLLSAIYLCNCHSIPPNLPPAFAELSLLKSPSAPYLLSSSMSQTTSIRCARPSHAKKKKKKKGKSAREKRR